MYLIVGLGNPGSKYALTRHNIGFMAIDYLAQGYGVTSFQTQEKAHVAKFKVDGVQIIAVKPQTFMNLSGTSVRPLLDFYKVPVENLLVIQDDIDQSFGKMRFHKNRGHGGHNGIRNITEIMGSQDYARLKLGVGRPPIPQMEIADYVLQNFNQEEQGQLPEFLNKSIDAIECFIFEGLQKASSQYNN